jgi:hypothetical protein
MLWDKIGVGILIILFGNVAQILEPSFIVDTALLWICLFYWWYNEYSQKNQWHQYIRKTIHLFVHLVLTFLVRIDGAGFQFFCWRGGDPFPIFENPCPLF